MRQSNRAGRNAKFISAKAEAKVACNGLKSAGYGRFLGTRVDFLAGWEIASDAV